MKKGKAKASEEKTATESLESENAQILFLQEENQNLLGIQKEDKEKNTQNKVSTTAHAQDPAAESDQAQKSLPAENVVVTSERESRRNYSKKL